VSVIRKRAAALKATQVHLGHFSEAQTLRQNFRRNF